MEQMKSKGFRSDWALPYYQHGLLRRESSAVDF